ncbi:MAG: ABC-F family ATP-binding cassette domain-containing protein, partial [Firmicutes bacterium]|nr:ABC-F family ATP-binding cassette domain-containing protein [Bacillota bacterium]
ILDEPTNHLDSQMIEELQKFLEAYQGTLLMVTHDRYFLDEVTDVILEIDKGKLYRYEEDYEGYLKLRQERLDSAVAAERKMAALYRKDLAWMMRGARARSTKQKAHIQRFEALRDREKIQEERLVEIESLPSRIGGKTIELDHISKSYGGQKLYQDFTYHFRKTDRIGIIGPNGCGKSTLIKTILGMIPPDSGTVTIGQTIRFGYFSQENELLDESARVIDYIRNTAEYIRTADGLVSASEMCDRFLFDPKMQYARIGKLSGGEKRRLYLLRVLMENPNVLILDEPTNDLDIQTLQILEDYLDRFAGIILVVSHDRYFLDRVVTRIFAFEEDGHLWQSDGGYEEYREHLLQAGKEAARSRDLRGSDKNAAAAGAEAPVRPQHKVKLSYKDQREYDTIEEEIDRLQKQSDELATQIPEAATDYERLRKLTEEKDALDARIEERMGRYLELQEMVDAL